MRYYCESCGRLVAEMSGSMRSGTDVIMYCRECSEPVEKTTASDNPGDFVSILNGFLGKYTD